jgi:hypothetical protein
MKYPPSSWISEANGPEESIGTPPPRPSNLFKYAADGRQHGVPDAHNQNFFLDFNSDRVDSAHVHASAQRRAQPPRLAPQSAQLLPTQHPGRAKPKSRPDQLSEAQMVGLHVPLRVGLRVQPAGRTDSDSPPVDAAVGDGMVTVVNASGDACFVKWDGAEEECGWYRCGVRGQYSLALARDRRPIDYSSEDLVRAGGNKEYDVEARCE